MKGTRECHGSARPMVFLVVAVLCLGGAGILYYKSVKTHPQSSSGEHNKPSNQVETGTSAESGGSFGGDESSGNKPRLQVSSEMEKWLAVLFDDSTSLQDRGNAALVLARSGTTPALEALRKALAEGSAGLRIMVAEALGECPHAEARLLLFSLLNDADARVVNGAIQGVARRGGLEAVDVLAGVMQDAARSESARLAAAEALGMVEDPNALKILAQVLTSTRDVDMASHVLEGLGQRSYDEVEGLFRLYLDSPELSSELRVAALEALSESPGDPSSLLLKQSTDLDPEVRAAAAWALSHTEDPGMAGGAVLEWLKEESAPEVRRRLYQALGNQEGVSAQEILPLLEGETSRSTQLAAWQWLAGSLQSEPGPDVISYFNETAIPLLQDVALHDGDFHNRLDSVMALSRANTTQSRVALEEIARSADDERVVRAARVGQ